MRELCRLVAVVLAVLFTSAAASVRAGTITGLTLSPTEAMAGSTITATATGSGPCGAVNIDWGDGAVITYATSTLPVSQTHAYQAAGTFNVRAQGMGNCDGEARAHVTIKPAPAPRPAPQLTAIELAPTPGVARAPVTITLRGSGPCRSTVDFGDGNSQQTSGDMPGVLRHTYAVPGRYVITATPAPPCGERRSAALQVVAPEGPPRLTGVEVAPSRDEAAGMRAIKVTGNGPCAYTIDFGDGNSETRTNTLPDTVQHNYPAPGRYTVTATAAAPCSGVARSTTIVGGREPGGRIARLDARPQLARPNEAIAITVTGSGLCRFTVDFDDGESRTFTETLPYRLTYRYVQPGDYELFTWADQPCTGEADALISIRRR
jgi:PKD repeat protein